MKTRQQAREYAANNLLEHADARMRDDYGYADHVTLIDRIRHANKDRTTAMSVLRGERDFELRFWESVS